MISINSFFHNKSNCFYLKCQLLLQAEISCNVWYCVFNGRKWVVEKFPSFFFPIHFLFALQNAWPVIISYCYSIRHELITKYHWFFIICFSFFFIILSFFFSLVLLINVCKMQKLWQYTKQIRMYLFKL